MMEAGPSKQNVLNETLARLFGEVVSTLQTCMLGDGRCGPMPQQETDTEPLALVSR